MSQPADEPVDYDVLLQFSTEPGGKPPESAESLAARVDALEQALYRSSSQIESLKSEVATLVGTVDDIGKTARRPVTWAPKPVSTRRRVLTTTAGIVFGLALGVMGSTLWPRNPIDPIVTVAATEGVGEQPAEPAVPSQPAEMPAGTTPEPAKESAPAIREEPPAPTPAMYVGTLSIDAAPGGDVFIDREAAGQTPLRIENLKAGSHLVWIEREGYRRFTRVVQVPANRVSRLWADLEPIQDR